MAVGVTHIKPITAMRAVIKIEEAKVVDSRYPDKKGRAQKQFATELRPLSGVGERDGETFSEWFTFPATGEIGANTKTGRMLTAALGENAQAETLEDLARELVGKTFAAQIGTSSDGQYSRVVNGTISATPPTAAEDDGAGDSEENVDDLPF